VAGFAAGAADAIENGIKFKMLRQMLLNPILASGKLAVLFSLLAVTVVRAQTTSPASANTAPAGALQVVNGDFSVLSGLTAGANGWYGGVPAGWQSDSTNTAYAVNKQAGPASPVCNVSVLGFLLQEVGTLTEAADVVMKFDVSTPWAMNVSMGAAILDGNRAPLVNAEFKAGEGQKLVAKRVPAGTKIIVEFWATGGTTPALDNVTVEKLALGAASAASGPAAPSGWLRIANGDFSDLSSLTAVGGGWYNGVPREWESTAKVTSYSVRSGGSKTPPVCNLSQLGFLLQEAGTLTNASDVVLQFDVTDTFLQQRAYTYGGFGSVRQLAAFDFKDPSTRNSADTWSARVKIGAALLDGNRQPLVQAEFRGGLKQKLTARNVPAGTKVIAEFWMTDDTLPALDNVSITNLPADMATSRGQFRIVNGDFSDLLGLTAGANGWFGGVPRGWESDAKNPTYAVSNQDGLQPPVCNVSQLGYLVQEVGTLTNAADVILKFDVSSPWPAGARLGAALLDSNRQPLVKADLGAGAGQEVVARKVPAGTKILAQFWAVSGTTPALDNVTVETVDPSVAATTGQSSSPHGFLRLVNGDFSALAGLSATRGDGWHDGVPTGWRAAARDTCYAVKVPGGANAPVCNVSQLGYLLQEVGTLTNASDVVLKFDVSDLWMSDAVLTAAILDAHGAKLASSTFQAQRGHTLVATNVPAGTTVFVRFAATDSAPGLQNVTVTNLAAGAWAASLRSAAAIGSGPGIMGELDAAFRNPPNLYRIIQYSRHEGAVLPIAQMREAGIGGVMLFMSKHNYLRNEEAWANMKTNIRLAKEAGMQVWVADDNGYPSGQAGGLVVAANPAFELRVLTPVVQRGQGQEKIRLDLPASAEKFVSAMIYPEKEGQPVYASGVPGSVLGNHVEVTGLAGPWVLQAFALKINNDAGSPAMGTVSGFGNTGHYPNLLDSAAMEKFVDLTHAEYARRLGSLTNQIDVFYCNEPHLGTIWHAGGERPGGEVFLPWVADMPQRFQKDHGYDLMPFLPALFSGNSDEARLVRRHFYQTVGNLFAENYTGRIARWAEARGVRSGGHLFLEERMDSQVISYGNFFQALQRQQIPGCDVAMPDPGDYWNFWMPRLISSAAQLQGRELVSVLIDPIVDRQTATLQPSPDFMLRFINPAALMGVNQFTNYVLWDQYPPEVYHHFNENVGRLGVMVKGARNVSSVAMYYPIETFQSLYVPSPKVFGEWLKDQPAAAAGHETQEKLARNLYQNGCDFSWLDADAVLRAEIREGRLVVGLHEYTSIIMPRVELLPLAVVQRLQRFEAAGGKVLWVDALPRLGDKPEEHARVRDAVATSRVISPEDVMSNLGPAFPESFRLRLDGKPDGLFITRWLRNGHCVNFLVNSAYSPLTTNIRLEGNPDGKIWVYDPADGSMTSREASGSLTLEPNTSLFLIEQP